MRVGGIDMGDNEFLELAARAAGYDYNPRHGAIVADGMPVNWNPLADDGDAQRRTIRP